jgi:glucosamine kinase
VSYYLGIDGGGTKTTCAVGDDSQLLATATSGPSNIVRVGESQARQSLQQCVRQACAAAGIAPAQVASTCIGGAGAARPEVAAMVQRLLAEIISTPIEVVGDMQIALEAAFDNGPGIIVNAGTGSFAYGRNREGKTARAGGWGFAISDEGSAHWIGRAAISAVLRADDQTQGEGKGLDHRSLPASLMKTWGVRSLRDLARVANSVPPPDLAALFPAVAASQDDLARQVLTSGGRELAQLAAIVIHRLFPGEPAVPVATTGGVFRHAALVREIFYNELRAAEPGVKIIPDLVDPVQGALRIARRSVK